MLLTDVSGKTMSAKTVFTSAITFLKKTALEVLGKHGVQYSSEHEINCCNSSCDMEQQSKTVHERSC